MTKLTPVDDPRFLLAVSEAHDALNYAESKHPNYNYSDLRQVAIIVEEAGEATQAVLNKLEDWERMGYNRKLDTEHRKNIRHEVAQTAAMCLRYLMQEQV